MDTPYFRSAYLEDIYLIPVAVAETAATPVLDEETRPLRDESGNIIYEG